MHNEDLVIIVEETLFSCIIKWLEWDFTYESSSIGMHIILKVGKYILKFIKWLNLHKYIALKLVWFSLKLFTWFGFVKLFFD